MTAIGTRLLEMGFGRPSGPLGRLGGWLMARGNADTERQLVDVADLDGQDVVLILGPGPGIGLEAAGTKSAHVIGIDPSEVMLAACRRRCADLIEQGHLRLAALATDVARAGFEEIETWTWEPPGRGAGTAAQLRATRRRLNKPAGTQVMR
ncbi:MAG: class I SAM-dependent methyltransferase [Pseudonocardiaceae bacterium]